MVTMNFLRNFLWGSFINHADMAGGRGVYQFHSYFIFQTNYKVDPAIIGGMVVSIGDKYADMSIATKMKKYTDLIKAAA